MSRTTPDELPVDGEIGKILSNELKLALPASKQDVHYADFSSIVSLLQHLGLDDAIFTSAVDDFTTIDVYFEQTDTLMPTLVDTILHSGIDSIKYLDAVYDYLSEEDTIDGLGADIIFVFGSSSTKRIERAVELYKSGAAKKILISGFGPFYKDKSEKPEAEALEKFAINEGVPKEDILTETESITIPDNIKRSLKLLADRDITLSSVILVNSPFAQRRGWVHFNKFTEGLEFVRVNAGVSYTFSKEGWYKSETGIRIIINEFIKLKGAELLNTA